jgi:SAM-dependent methyltransferase
MPEPELGAVRAAYDTVAESYAAQITGLSAETPLEIALIDDFAARIRSAGGGPVLDAGSGPGRVAAYLHSQGLDVSGVDLSPAMVDVARRSHPGIRFAVGPLQHLDVVDGSLAGILAWYSIIHTPLAELPVVFDEFRRAMAPGGYLLVGIHVGTGTLRVTQSYGHDVSVELQLLRPEEVTVLLESCGFSIVATLSRAPEGRERRPQAFVLARRTGERRPA